MNTETQFKFCGGCKEELSIEQFSKDKSKLNGIKSNCKECTKKYCKAYYETNKEKLKEYKKAYRQTNKEQIKEYKKAYDEANKFKINREKYNARTRVWYEANCEKAKAAHRAWSKTQALNVTESYARQLISKRILIKKNQIPKTFVDLFRTHLLLTREIKRAQHEDR
jgi:hypothetical protein